MSGTSLDGIDAALIELEDRGGDSPAWSLIGFHTTPFTPDRREAIHEAILHGGARRLARLHVELGEWFAEASSDLLEKTGTAPGEVRAIGSHGQTIWHEPPASGPPGATLQLGDPATIAERTGITVIADFRNRDVAAGGEGAPLVPWVDRLLFQADHERVLQNIGGMGNLTRLPPIGSDAAVVAFDTGPGNAVLNVAVELATDGRECLDQDGRRARAGRVDEALVEELLQDPFFHRPPPRSTGRERFGRDYVEALVERKQPGSDDDWADLLATLTALVARTIVDATRRWAPVEDGEVIVTGGGARNPVLMDFIREGLAPVPVRTGDVLGFDPDAKEAIAFAVLAWAHITGRPSNVPSVTGARGPRVLGSLTPGRGAAGDDTV